MKQLIIWFCFFPLTLQAKASAYYQVKFHNYDHGKKVGESQFIYHNQVVFLSKPTDKIQAFIDYGNDINIQTINDKGTVYKNTTHFSALTPPKFETKPEKILGYDCKYAVFSYFSNRIEIWYTEAAPIQGTLYSKFIPSKTALVLKIVINGNRTRIAQSIEQQEGDPPLANFNTATLVSQAEFEEIKINSRFEKRQVFTHQIINFDGNYTSSDSGELAPDITYHFSKGSVLMKKIKLTPDLKNSGYVFAKLTCQSNGDAYDRTGSVFILPGQQTTEVSILDAYQKGLDVLPAFTDHNGQQYQGFIKTNQYDPPIEVLRFFTSFGANHFNEKRAINNYAWAEAAEYKQDISTLIPNDQDEIWIGVFIGNYDKGGHRVSLELDFYPTFGDEPIQQSKKYINPLFLTVNTLEMSGQNYGKLFNNDTLRVEFNISDSIENLTLLYTTTGHGGWGNGDEFNPKRNKILIDGKPVFEVTPWRTDCATYRLLNPASGNFENGLSSSDLSRSNWCPGTLTPPFVIPLEWLSKGQHTIEIVIDQGADEGNSSSSWGVSGVLTGTIIK